MKALNVFAAAVLGILAETLASFRQMLAPSASCEKPGLPNTAIGSIRFILSTATRRAETAMGILTNRR